MELLTKILEKSAAHAEIVSISAILLAFSWQLLFPKRRYLAASVMLAMGLVVLGYFGGILEWISGLGADSFLEINSFDSKEALFWVSTFLSSLSQMLMPFNKTTLLVVVEAMLLSVVLYLLILWRPAVRRGLAFVLVAGMMYVVHLGYAGFESGRVYIHTLQTQFDRHPRGFKASEDIDLFVYIGESTSSLNMSLYGYPLPTTPRLDELFRNDIGFLRFDKVRSTHTHTSPSLLRAFAVTSMQQNGQLIQWGIGNVLKQSGLTPHLYSVQPLNGSFAAFSRFVFDGFDLEVPREDRYKGNLATPKVKDHQLLEVALEGSGVVFFHSYGGHGTYGDGAYLNFIEKSMSDPVPTPVIAFDGAYGSLFSEMLGAGLVKDAATYDQAITYIDRNVAHAIENIKSRGKPAALVYFSDHGDAVYAKRGHESSKFIDEMSTVPMILYFNEAYRKKYPEIFSRYQKSSTTVNTKLLDQITPSVLDILRISSDSALDVPSLASSSKHPRLYIMERETLSGTSRIDLEYDNKFGFSKSTFFGGTPEPTYISMINERFGADNKICYHRSDSYAKAIRGAAIANCLEFDLVVNGNELDVYHPPATATGFRIEHIFSIAEARKNSLWIDSKNLDDPKACNTLAAYLESNHARVGKILVEFPGNAIAQLHDLQTCGSRLRSIGARTSYYVPTQLIKSCAPNPTENSSACKELDHNVQMAMESGIFTDISFDFIGYPAITTIMGAEKLRWNTWAINAQDFHRIPRKSLDFIIMDTSIDPNTY